MNAPAYICRIHGHPLDVVDGRARCKECGETYSVRDGIWLLDVVHRPDSAAFDEQALLDPIPLDLQKAAHLLGSAGEPTISLSHANILDVGCGLGDLTYGLAQSPSIRDSDIYAFDHSFESVRQAARNTRGVNGNRVHFSTQDALQLFFADGFFDLVAGSAVLHHFLDYPGFLREAARITKPGGLAIFSEPFFDGYFWPALFLKNAFEEQTQSLADPAFAVAKNLIEMVEYMARNRGNTPALQHMTDKHFFLESEVSVAAEQAGFRSIRFANVAAPAFYQDWMPHFLDIYHVKHEGVRRSAIAQYDKAKALAGPLAATLFSHFKFIVMRKG